MRIAARFGRGGISLAALMIAVSGTAASADTLRDAFVSVYSSNPTLTGARAGLRATDEDVGIVRAQGLPDVSATGSYSEFLKRSVNSPSAPIRALYGRADATVPLYLGGGVRNQIKAAKARVEQGRAGLKGTESDIFAQTVAAYMDVLRDLAIVDLNASNVKVLDTNLQASRDRFQVGDLTRTDVAQSEASLAGARAQAESARAQLDASRQTYLEIVGKFPDNLEAPPPLPPLPAMSDDAVDIAVENNPDLEAARQAAKAAGYDIGTARALAMPKISAFANADYTDYRGTLARGVLAGGGGTISQTDKTATVGVQALLPLYQGGEPAARVRQAKARQSQAIEQATAVERSVIANVRTAFSRYQASLEVIESSQTAVSANELALEGTRAEQGVGTRNLLDVLNAEQALLNSRSTLVTARRDAYVAGFALIAAMGRAQAKDLGLDGGSLYDPVANYKRVHGNIFDWDMSPRVKPVAPSTRSQPSVSAVTVPQK